MLPPSLTTLLQMAAARLIIHLGVIALPPVPTHVMPLLRMVRMVPTNQQQQDQGQTGNVPARMPASLKELKEMWKQYMKTLFSGQPPTRVPPSQKPQARAWAVTHRKLANRQDTLRSYEQAVLAHRVPLMLHLAPRHCGNTTLTDPAATAAMPPPPGKGNRASPA